MHEFKWVSFVLLLFHTNVMYGSQKIKTPHMMITISEHEELLDYTPITPPSLEEGLKNIWLTSGGSLGATIDEISQLYREVVKNIIFRQSHPVCARAFGGVFLESSQARRYHIQESHDLYGCPIDINEAWKWVYADPLHCLVLSKHYHNSLLLFLTQSIKKAVLLSKKQSEK